MNFGQYFFYDYFYIIWIAAFLTAIVSATVGMLGGTMLIGVLAQFLKMEVLIPLHGLIQLTSNSSRAWFLRASVNWAIATESISGVVIGSIIASFYVVRVDDAVYNVILGTFILGITILPMIQQKLAAPKTVAAPVLRKPLKGKWALLGFAASFMGLFFGAVGTLVGAVFLASKLEKKEMVATQAACQIAVHVAKVIVFMALGFVIQPWLLLLAGTLIMTFAGSWVGTKILDRIPEKQFRILVTITILALAIRLIWSGSVSIFK